MDLAARLVEARVVPVLTIARVECAVPLARALVGGGLDMLEVTLRSAAALDAIRAIAEALPAATVGAGTLTRPEDFAAVSAAGARFAVSPGFTTALAEAAQDYPALPYLPAVATASELMTALAAGYDCLKFFPAGTAGGVEALKALAGPFPEVRFCPTGGIDANNAGRYLALQNVAAVGGSWVAPVDAVTAGDWQHITTLAREASGL